MAKVTTPLPMALTNGRATFGLFSASGGSIRPRSLAYERLVFGDDGVAGVLLSNPLHSAPQSQHLKLTAVKKIGGQWRAPEDWTGEVSKFHCRDKQDERLQELLLIVSHSDSDPAAVPAMVSSGTPFEVSISNVGCWKWQGQASVQILSDDGITRGDNTSSATQVVFEPPADYAGGPMTLSVTGGAASGLFNFTSAIPRCEVTLTGPTTAINGGDVGALWFNLDLKQPISPAPDRKVLLAQGVKFIDSTQVAICNGERTVTPAPATGWAWLNFPLITNPMDVSADGRSIRANVTIPAGPARTVHNFNFTAMRE
jgi:hypothetical protein